MVFLGRSPRKEFWMFFLWNLSIGCSFLFWVLILSLGLSAPRQFENMVISGVVYTCVTLLPCTSAAVRRLHDIGKGGWNVMTPFIPVIGLIALFVWLSQKGDEGTNAYGSPCNP